jgi:hypothetical protein
MLPDAMSVEPRPPGGAELAGFHRRDAGRVARH